MRNSAAIRGSCILCGCQLSGADWLNCERGVWEGEYADGMTGIQPELWVDRPAEAVAFYGAAFGARVLHQVGEGDDIVAQLAVGDAAFWVSPGGADGPRFSPGAIGGATGRTLLVTDDPDAMFSQALAAGASAASEVADEHGWRLGRIFDPFGHEWEIGRPLGSWPPE